MVFFCQDNHGKINPVQEVKSVPVIWETLMLQYYVQDTQLRANADSQHHSTPQTFI